MSTDRRFPARRPIAALATITTLAMMLLGLTPGQAGAGLVLQVNSTTAQAGGVGSFDVVLTSNGGTFGVGGFSVELSVAAGSGVKFTGVSTTTTAAPYLFGTLQSSPFTFATFPNTDFTASDSDMTAPGFVNVTPNQPFGVEHVTFSVAAGTASGPIAVSIVAGNNTAIGDVAGAPINFTPTNGTITVGSTVVPEPSSLVLTGLALTTGLGGRLVARRRVGR